MVFSGRGTAAAAAGAWSSGNTVGNTMIMEIKVLDWELVREC
jgi:hypothetical protein